MDNPILDEYLTLVHNKNIVRRVSTHNVHSDSKSVVFHTDDNEIALQVPASTYLEFKRLWDHFLYHVRRLHELKLEEI